MVKQHIIPVSHHVYVESALDSHSQYGVPCAAFAITTRCESDLDRGRTRVSQLLNHFILSASLVRKRFDYFRLLSAQMVMRTNQVGLQYPLVLQPFKFFGKPKRCAVM